MIEDETFRKIANETVPAMRKAMEEIGLVGLATPSTSMTAKVLLDDDTWAHVRVTVELDPEEDEEHEDDHSQE